MEEKSAVASPVLLIESASPVVTEWKIESFYKLTDSDWNSLEQEAERKLALNPLDVSALHLCALKIRANYSMPSCFKVVMDQQEALAKEGNIEAIVNYAYFLYLLEDHDKAISQLYIAMEKGSAVAMYNRGKMYEFGLGSKAHIDNALLFYYQAAKQGLEKALLVLNEENNRKVGGGFYLILLQLFSSSISSPSILTILTNLNSEVYLTLLNEITNLLCTDQMSQDKFIVLFNAICKVKFRPEHSEKISSLIAFALQKSYISWAHVCVHRELINVDEILKVLEKLGTRKLIAEILLSDLVLFLEPKGRMSDIQSACILSLMSGMDLVSALFGESLQLYLKKIQCKFKESPSSRSGILQFLDSLPTSLGLPIKVQCIEWEVNDLIALHQEHLQKGVKRITVKDGTTEAPKGIKDLEEIESKLSRYSKIVPRVDRYLKGARHNDWFTRGEELKNDAIKGNKSSLDQLVSEASNYPDIMYWLGRYYEECTRDAYIMNYDSKAIGCYNAVSEWEGPISDHCRVLAYERLALCYQDGKFVKKDLDQAYYYYYKAGVLGSTNSISELVNAFGDTKRVILANLYLAMLKGLKGKLSEYYGNPYLIAAVNLDKEVTNAVIIELSERGELNIHHRIALLQVAFRHNPYIKGRPHERMLELFKYWHYSDRNYKYYGYRNNEFYIIFSYIFSYINPHYFVDLISQLVKYDFENSFISLVAIMVCEKLHIKNESITVMKNYKKYCKLNIKLQFVEDDIYHVSSIPVQEKKKNETSNQDIDRASAFGQDKEFVDKSDKLSAPSVLSTLSLSARSFISRGGNFISSFGKQSQSTETNSKNEKEWTSSTSKGLTK